MTQDEKDAIERFPLLAREFCNFIENCDECKRKQLIRELSVRLAGLCEVAARLPWVNPATEGADATSESTAVHADEWHKLAKTLGAQLGELNDYWEVFDPTEKEDPVRGSLSSDIAEIYLDLKDALKLLTSGAALEDVYFDWRLEFRSHWSRHATSALKVTLFVSDLA